MLLRVYHRLARLLAPCFWWLVAAAVVFGAVFFQQLLTSEQAHQASILLWLLLMLAMLALLLVIKWFAQPAPEPDSNKGFFQRLKIGVIRFGYLLLALITSAVLLAITVLGLRIGFGALMRWLLGA